MVSDVYCACDTVRWLLGVIISFYEEDGPSPATLIPGPPQEAVEQVDPEGYLTECLRTEKDIDNVFLDCSTHFATRNQGEKLVGMAQELTPNKFIFSRAQVKAAWRLCGAIFMPHPHSI